MKNRNTYKYICIALGLIATVLLLFLLQKLLVPKYQKGVVEGSMIEEYYESRVPSQVLILGDCEVYENISTVKLFEEYGISSYIRGSAQQLVWQSYYLLEDTLRYETPKVVVFNVLALKYGQPQSESYNRMTLDGMRWSLSKWNAVRASMMPEERMSDYIFPFLRYHSRWSDLRENDFAHIFNKDKVTVNGYYLRADVSAETGFPSPMPLTDYSLPEPSVEYLRRMADLCAVNGISLVLIKAPVLYPHWYDEWDEQVEDLADELGVPYINFIYLRDVMGLDMQTDTYDGGLHLNVNGAEKFARYLGAYLTDHYELTDYRDDPEAARLWEENIEFYNSTRQAQEEEIERYGELMSWGINAVED